MNRILKKNYVSYFIILFTLFVTHLPLLFVSKLENPDAGPIYDNLNKFQFPLGYFKALINFETFDFQPVRDITFYLDIWVFDHTGIVISVFLNCFVWAAACYQVMKILQKVLKIEISIELLLLVLCFAVYPIFEPAVDWGIARKHLLGFFFILCATHSLLEWEEEKKSFLPLISYYLLSVLSIPISVAWPAWVFLREGHFKGLRNPRIRSLIISLFFVSLLVAAINFAYYKTSFTFLELYPQKVSVADPVMMLINLGYQFKQILLPYDLSLFYTFDRTAFIYFGLLSAFAIAVIYFSRKHKGLWMWPAFALPPLFVTLSTPHLYFDTYVIVPAFALFMFLATISVRYLPRYGKFLIIPFLIWGVVTFKEYKLWNDPYRGYENAMRIIPNCTNAQTLAARYLIGGKKKLPNELYDYMQLNKCFEAYEGMSPSMALKMITIESLILFYEDDIDMEYRERRLHDLGHRSIFVMIFYMAFLAKTNQPEKLEALMAAQNKTLEGINVEFTYDEFFAKLVPPYCDEHKLKECQKFLKRWHPDDKRMPYF